MPRRRTRPRHPRLARNLAWGAVLIALLALAGVRLPMLRALPELLRLQRLSPADRLPVPVQGVRPRDLRDTWGGPRSGGRKHEGIDIFAPRGTPVTSATRGVVVRIGDGGLGGKQVWVLGPGGERHYYAHLDGWAPALSLWQVVAPGDALGIVGDTGNAKGTPPHLHYGIYRVDGARNPYPRLRPAD